MMRVLAPLILLVACRPPDLFRCMSSEQCSSPQRLGVCEAAGYCSFDEPSGECPSGRRYGSFAPEGVGGVCVDPSAEAPLFGTGQDQYLQIKNGQTTFASPSLVVDFADGQTIQLALPQTSLQRGDVVLVHQTAGGDFGTWEQRTIARVEPQSVELTSALRHSYLTDYMTRYSQLVRVPQYRDAEIEAGGTLSQLPWDGLSGSLLAMKVSGQLHVRGTLIAGSGFRAGNYGCGTSCAAGYAGESERIGTPFTVSANGSGGGGGPAGSDCGMGAGGGNATAGENGLTMAMAAACNNPGGAAMAAMGGPAIAVDDLRARIPFGGAGGSGSAGTTGSFPGGGGRGGGVIIIWAYSVWVEDGSILANGEPGVLGDDPTYGCAAEASTMGGGGGGAGGSILLFAHEADLNTTRVSATGGLGGLCGSADPTFRGGRGGSGRIAIFTDRAGMVSGSTEPSYQPGLLEGVAR